MITEIKNNYHQILDFFKKKNKEIENYIYIKNKYNKGVDVEKDVKFQEVYKKFYIMNSAGLTDEYFKKYFKLLNSRNFNNKNSLSQFLLETKDIINRRKGRSVQFSFASKALHTANNNLPIYDCNIGYFFYLNQPMNDLKFSIEHRIFYRQALYDKLFDRMDYFLKKDEVASMINDIRKDLALYYDLNDINNFKLFDFIIWAHIGILKKSKKKL